MTRKMLNKLAAKGNAFAGGLFCIVRNGYYIGLSSTESDCRVYSRMMRRKGVAGIRIYPVHDVLMIEGRRMGAK